MTADIDDPRHCAIRLHAATARLGRALRAATAAPSAGAAALSVLGLLHRQGELAPSQLARLEGVRLQTLTRLLAELEEAGLVRRRPDPADARRGLLSLTRAGARALATHVHGRQASLQAALAEALTGPQRRALLAACELIERVAAQLQAERSAA